MNLATLRWPRNQEEFSWRNQWIRDAKNEGMNMSEIAKVVDLSKARIYQILAGQPQEPKDLDQEHRRERYRRNHKAGYRGRLVSGQHTPEHFYWTERFGH